MSYNSHSIKNLQLFHDIFKANNPNKEVNDENLTKFYHPLKINGDKYLVECRAQYGSNYQRYTVEENNNFIIVHTNIYTKLDNPFDYIFFNEDIIIPTILKRYRRPTYMLKGILGNKIKNYLNNFGFLYKNIFLLPENKKFKVPTFGKITYKLLDNEKNVIKEYNLESTIYKLRNDYIYVPSEILYFNVPKNIKNDLFLELSSELKIPIVLNKGYDIYQKLHYSQFVLKYIEVDDEIIFTISFFKSDNLLKNFPVVLSENFSIESLFESNKIPNFK